MYSYECSEVLLLTKNVMQCAFVTRSDICTPFMLVFHIATRRNALHCDFVLFEALGRTTCVECVCLNLDVPVSTIYCRNALHNHISHHLEGVTHGESLWYTGTTRCLALCFVSSLSDTCARSKDLKSDKTIGENPQKNCAMRGLKNTIILLGV